MQKAEIIQLISKKTGVHKVDVLVILETYFEEVKQTLREGEAVTVRKFGAFTRKKRAAKVGRHIIANTFIAIPEQYTPVFLPAKEFKAALKTVPIKK
jgi:DNA-binding protein HU-beta